MGVGIKFGPYLQQVGEHEAVIVWGTTGRTTGWVEVAPDDTVHFYGRELKRHYHSDMGRKLIDTVHSVRITGLEPGTTYRYRVFGQKVEREDSYGVTHGDVASTRVYKREPLRFTTLDGGKGSVKFSVVNDIHADSARLHKLLGGVKRGTHDFVVFNGDMVSHMDSERQVLGDYLWKAVEMFAKETPFYLSRGNHEGRGVFSRNFQRYYPTSTGRPYYTFRQGPVFFVVMDGGEDKADNDIEYYGMSVMDDYRREEAEWLRGVVESDEYRDAPYRVVLCHVPPYGDSWHGNLEWRELFMPILNGTGVDVMLCGHLHRRLYVPAGSQGADFPVVVNSNVEALDVDADGEGLRVRARGVDGKETFRVCLNSNRP